MPIRSWSKRIPVAPLDGFQTKDGCLQLSIYVWENKNSTYDGRIRINDDDDFEKEVYIRGLTLNEMDCWYQVQVQWATNLGMLIMYVLPNSSSSVWANWAREEPHNKKGNNHDTNSTTP